MLVTLLSFLVTLIPVLVAVTVLVLLVRSLRLTGELLDEVRLVRRDMSDRTGAAHK